jgi:hypothetical protein
MWDMRNEYKILVEKPERERSFGRDEKSIKIFNKVLKGRDANGCVIKVDLDEIGCEDVDWIYLTQDRIHWWAVL